MAHVLDEGRLHPVGLVRFVAGLLEFGDQLLFFPVLVVPFVDVDHHEQYQENQECGQRCDDEPVRHRQFVLCRIQAVAQLHVSHGCGKPGYRIALVAGVCLEYGTDYPFLELRQFSDIAVEACQFCKVLEVQYIVKLFHIAVEGLPVSGCRRFGRSEHKVSLRVIAGVRPVVLAHLVPEEGIFCQVVLLCPVTRLAIIAAEGVHSDCRHLPCLFKEEQGRVIVRLICLRKFCKGPDYDGLILYYGVFGLRIDSVSFQRMSAGVDEITLFPADQSQVTVSLIESVFAVVFRGLGQHLQKQFQNGGFVVLNVFHIHGRAGVGVEEVFEFAHLERLFLQLFHGFQHLFL